ncbi:MAG: XRE family transcriptional regulator [Flavobacterium sp.]|nr:MAG: XRE family transcriptional regulator [Flavobacterium sp.]
MEKLKLQKARNKRGLSQEEIAVLANMDQTTYGRKEKGISKITSNEWKRFATILDLSLKEIFEEDIISIDENDFAPENNLDYCSLPEYILASLKRYIDKLETELKAKDDEITKLKERIAKRDEFNL